MSSPGNKIFITKEVINGEDYTYEYEGDRADEDLHPASTEGLEATASC
jgi:hypothetical protein